MTTGAGAVNAESGGDVKDRPVVSFRMTLWRWLLVGWTSAQVGYAAVLVLMEMVLAGGRGLHDPRFWVFYSVGAAAVTVLLVPAMWAYVLIWRVWVGPDTLRGSDMWGRFVIVTWGSVRAVRPINLLALPYLRVDSDETRRVMWLPLFLVDDRRFAELVAEYAGADHPVTRAVWRRVEEDS